HMLLDYVKLKEIKPALFGYIREARAMLDPGSVADEKSVHDVRVLMKKSRAAMKLIKPQVDPEMFKREYSAFREVGMKMRQWRENSVHRKHLRYLKKKYPKIFDSLTDNEKLNLLLNKPEPEKEISEGMTTDLAAITSILDKSSYRIRFQSMNNLDTQLLVRELEQTYSQVTDCYIMARNYQKTANLHEFRKKAKDFLYQLYFFRSMKPRSIRALEKKLDSLTQCLGRYNDLSVLVKALGYRYTKDINEPGLDELILMIRQEQDKALSKVWPAAHSIFAPGRKLMDVLGFRLLVI
ncbi:MAG: CHAD domain-containing protein, partial [Bacteroidales bacterium]